MGTPGGTSHFEKGDNTYIAFVFACPGWFEEFHKRPAAGDTGQNLHRLLKILLDWGVPNIPTREHLTITNSYDQVMYSEKDGDTVPSESQIQETTNLTRLEAELAPITDWVVCCGKEAQFAGSLLNAGKRKIVNIRHLSLQSVNQETVDLYGLPINKGTIKDPWNRSRARLEVVAKELLTEMNMPERVPKAESLGTDVALISRAWGEVVIVTPADPTEQHRALIKKTVRQRALKFLRKVRPQAKAKSKGKKKGKSKSKPIDKVLWIYTN